MGSSRSFRTCGHAPDKVALWKMGERQVGVCKRGSGRWMSVRRGAPNRIPRAESYSVRRIVFREPHRIVFREKNRIP